MLTGKYCFKYLDSIKMLLPLSLPEIAINARTYPSSVKFDTKIWLHRVNSVQRVKIIQEKYKGIEIDVLFDPVKKCFDVHHSSAASIGLCLEELLQNIKDPSEHYFWLDVKNLDSTNQKSILNYLQDLTDRYKIRKNIIIESTNPYLLSAFTDCGF
jgi:hypothetical protein